MSNLTRLDLADNSFGDCYQDIADALRICTNLEYLDIHDCCLGDDGIVEVCNALLCSKAPLSFLSISGNEIGENSMEGIKSVAKLIDSINDSIVSFSASENEMKSPGVRIIARAFRSDTVKEIYLNQNEFGSIGANELIKMAQRVPNLEVIELDDNGFLPAIVAELNETFGDKLGNMDGNDDDDDADEGLDPEDLEDDLGIGGEDDVVEKNAEVDALTEAFAKVDV